MKSLALYTVLRVVVFAVVLALLWLVFGGRVSIWAVVLLSLLVTGVVSLVAFRSQSAQAGAALGDIVTRIRLRYRASRAAEDVDDDE
ncbi:MAG TPA: DUF4229 domain-containing protein [Actinopolymorphaceae bacterium]